MNYNILVIDDEEDIRNLICDILNDENYDTRTARTDLEALSLLDEKIPTAVILDIWLQGSELDGLAVLEIIKKKHPYLPVIMISGHGNIETAVNSLKIGADDYIEKPFTADKLLIVIKRACEMAKLRKENAELRIYATDGGKLIGNSPVMQLLKQNILKIAPTSSRVLIDGPVGCGKKLVAKIIHDKSKRSNQPFIVFSPSGMNDDKAELELFGDENKNLFSTTRKVGVLELADSGTLFIDEVGDLPIRTQNKLLNFLQSQFFTRVDGKNNIKSDVRIISSTKKDLKKMIAEGKFREDLYYRLNVVQISVPNLTERKEDIPLLSEYFFRFFHETGGFPVKKFANDALLALQKYDWPGNLRQMRNVIEWILIMIQDHSVITSSMLPPEITHTPNEFGVKKVENFQTEIIDLPLREAREIFEKQYLNSQLIRFDNNITKMAVAIGMERSALHRKLKLLEIATQDD